MEYEWAWQSTTTQVELVRRELGLGHKLTDEIEGMTVHNGWAEYYDDFVDYCLVDTTLLRDIDNRLNCTDYHIALQQVAGVQFGTRTM